MSQTEVLEILIGRWLSAKDLAEILGLNPTTIHANIRKLTDQRLIKRRVIELKNKQGRKTGMEYTCK